MQGQHALCIEGNLTALSCEQAINAHDVMSAANHMLESNVGIKSFHIHLPDFVT